MHKHRRAHTHTRAHTPPTHTHTAQLAAIAASLLKATKEGKGALDLPSSLAHIVPHIIALFYIRSMHQHSEVGRGAVAAAAAAACSGPSRHKDAWCSSGCARLRFCSTRKNQAVRLFCFV